MKTPTSAKIIAIAGALLATAIPACSPIVSRVRAANTGSTQVTINAERYQPIEWPIVVEVTLTNTGERNIQWPSGGPGRYPPADDFVVMIRVGSSQEWKQVEATNGQASFRGGGPLKPGESVVVPLAVPAGEDGAYYVRVTPRYWDSTVVAETTVTLVEDASYVDLRRAKVIEAVVTGGSPFWQHLARRYADAVVLDAMLKLVTVDNPFITERALWVLRCQATLPIEAGPSMAELLRRWVPREPRPEWGGLRENLLFAALKTQHEEPRQAVLDLLGNRKLAGHRFPVINALWESPGDVEWLRRVRAVLLEAKEKQPRYADEQPSFERAIKSLDSRIKAIESGQPDTLSFPRCS